MLAHLIRKELLDQLLSLRFAIACAICLLAFMLSSLMLSRDYREAMSTYNMNLVVHRNELLQRTEVWSLYQGLVVDRPLNVMYVLVRGLVPELTESVRIQEGGRLDFPESYELNPVIRLFPEVDFAFIVGIILSLLALAFSYDAVSGERESGVLKLLMSYSVPRDLVLLGKWIGGYLALVAPFLLAFLAGLVLAVLFPQVAPTLESTLSILGLLVLALLYLGAIFSLGLFVSCRTGLASTSITVLLLTWVVLILALPNMAPYVTSQVFPAPSRESVDREKQEVQQEGGRKIQEMVREEQQRTGKQMVWADEAFRAKLEEFQKDLQVQMQKVEDGYLATMRMQTRWSGIAARLSPLTSFNLAALDLSAAGLAQETRFVDALRTYGQTWQAYSKQKREALERFYAEKQKQSKDGRISITPEEMAPFNKMDLSDYPRFKFEFMGFVDRLGAVWVDVLLLGLWNVVFFMLAYLSFLRRDVQ
jgi:ABC-type transport system involved in multi-copper enzyme maturation permease subunit